MSDTPPTLLKKKRITILHIGYPSRGAPPPAPCCARLRIHILWNCPAPPDFATALFQKREYVSRFKHVLTHLLPDLHNYIMDFRLASHFRFYYKFRQLSFKINISLHIHLNERKNLVATLHQGNV